MKYESCRMNIDSSMNSSLHRIYRTNEKQEENVEQAYKVRKTEVFLEISFCLYCTVIVYVGTNLHRYPKSEQFKGIQSCLQFSKNVQQQVELRRLNPEENGKDSVPK